MTFASLGLSGPLVRAVIDLGYGAPTAVQTAAIPAVLGGGDLCVSAETGSGKTAAFALPLLQRLAATPPRSATALRALVLVPTRELGTQVADVLVACGRYQHEHQRVAVIVGGGSVDAQTRQLREGCEIAVATPGRLLDQLERGAISLNAIEMLVIDEADKLLSLGFSRELNLIVSQLPRERQTLLFSATFPPKVQGLAETLLRNPIRINLDAGAVAKGVTLQRAIRVDAARRTMLLRSLLKSEPWSQLLVFVATRHAADHVAAKLRAAEVSASALHGKLLEEDRMRALYEFKGGRTRVLVATDLAARGIDIAGLAAVVNYDLPRSPADYVHRVGRTGRAGEEGVAVSFVTAENEAHWLLIEKRYGLSLVLEELSGFEPTDVAMPRPLDANGGVKGQRKSKKDKLREAAAIAASRTK